MDIKEFAKQIAPYIATELTQIPTIRGNASRIKLGTECYINNAVLNTNSGNIILEDYVFCGLGVSLITGEHDITKKNQERIQSYPKTGNDIIIRQGVWLASNVTVLGPCEIGAHSVIAAGSLVVRDVPPNCVYAGSPARFVKEIEFG